MPIRARPASTKSAESIFKTTGIAVDPEGGKPAKQKVCWTLCTMVSVQAKISNARCRRLQGVRVGVDGWTGRPLADAALQAGLFDWLMDKSS